MTRECSLQEQWFVRDALEKGLDKHPHLSLLSDDPDEALRMCYRMSREIRVSHIMAGRFDEAKKVTNEAVLEALETFDALIRMASLKRDEVEE